MVTRGIGIGIAIAIGIGFTATASAQTADSVFTRRDVMIPTRDGTKLFTAILAPRNRPGPLPILMTRTPYGADGAARGLMGGNRYRELIAEGYIFVYQDIRGLNKSEGQFVMNRPPLKSKVDESTDTYDAIDWLIKNVPNNNGRVGIFGISYPGWLSDQALINPHPALKAASPQATMGDTWMGDDFFHQGAWRQTYATEYAWMMEASTDQSVLPSPKRFDTYTWYLSFPNLDSLSRTIGATNWPTWRRFVEHPAYDSVWQERAVWRYLKHTTVPTLTVGGVWDQEDLYGPQATYRAREASDAQKLNYIVLGPWYHGQWAGENGDSLGNIKFGSSTSVYYRREIEAPWFAYWLKGKGTNAFAEARVFDAGAREWRSFDSWPPKSAVSQKLYFGADGSLSFNAPTATAGSDSFVSDPFHPVPYRPRPVEWTYGPGSRWRRWMTEDQRFVEGRPDVLVWQTQPLTSDVTIAGDVIAHLVASTTGSDADWAVKLIDVYPDSVDGPVQMRGYQLMVAGEIMRGRYWKSFETPTAIPSDTPTPFTVDLHQTAYTFKAGHRIMVQLHSTWFPLYDRNPQTFVQNIFKARPSDYKPETHTVFRNAAQPSNVEVLVVSQGARADVQFVRDMILHHGQAITMSAMVQTRSGRNDLKMLAERITVGQSDEIKRMERWLGPQASNNEHSGHEAHNATGAHAQMPGMLTDEELGRLYAASGTEFDRLFLEFMIRHHEGALTMVERLLAGRSVRDPELYQLANGIDADQRAEIARMRSLLQNPK